MKKQFDIYIPKVKVLNGKIRTSKGLKTEVSLSDFREALIECDNINFIDVIFPKRTINLK